MTELVTFGETALRLSPPGDGRLETTDELDVWASGAASNVAVTASRLGTETTWTSTLADTPLGRRAVSELRGHGVTTDLTWTDADESRQGLTFFERGNEPRGNLVLDDRRGTAIESVEPSHLPMDAIQEAGAVFVSGESIALGDAVAETALAALRAASGAAVLGVDHRPDLWSAEAARETLTEMFPAVDILVVNEEQAETVLQVSGRPPEIAHQIGSEYDFQTVVITQGDRGALVWHDETIHDRDAVETEPVETSGQHAAFTGAYLGRRVAGESVSDALTHGVAAAALSRTIPGPVPAVNPDEVERVVETMDGGSGGGGRSGIR
ncbi:sugar kinase [Halorientalis litorea]|uniref:sugar kinase n=1 Tax=Halorientalis litorea TaxID=2931977 RepID=UPI001FF31E89|nr:sugar kinase [Halorientalis litorea]